MRYSGYRHSAPPILPVPKSPGPAIDLSDMRLIAALLKDGTVTRAAERLGVTQSAVSYTLERLRKRFDDPLFVRVGNRMAPTPKASRLAAASQRVLSLLEAEMAGLTTFDPNTTQREFRIGVNEVGAITLVPKIVRYLRRLAPHAQLTPVPVQAATVSAALETGELDLAAGHFPDIDAKLLQQFLYKRDYACIVRRDHPSIGASLTLDEFSRIPQIRVDSTPVTQAWLDRQLTRRTLSATVSMSMQHIAAIPFIVASSDLVAIVPLEVAKLFEPIAAVRVVELPMQIPPVEIHQYWHARVANEPALQFLRNVVFESART